MGVRQCHNNCIIMIHLPPKYIIYLLLKLAVSVANLNNHYTFKYFNHISEKKTETETRKKIILHIYTHQRILYEINKTNSMV